MKTDAAAAIVQDGKLYCPECRVWWWTWKRKNGRPICKGCGTELTDHCPMSPQKAEDV